MRCLPALGAVLLGLMTPALDGCRRPPGDAIAVAVIGSADSMLTGGPRLSAAGQLVRAATAEGLVALDAQGQVVPALAERWIVTDNGASYIFRLRDGTWPDGSPLTGDTVAAALRRTLADLHGTPLGLDLADVGEIRVMTDRVLELRLDRPVPELLQLLAQPELGMAHRQRGSGPWRVVPGPVTSTGAVRLTPIPAGRLGLPQSGGEDAGDDGATHAVDLRALPAPDAAAAFARGDVAVVLGGSYADLSLGAAAAGLSRMALRLDPAPGLFGLAVLGDGGPLASAELRGALDMAIDREAIGTALGLTGWAASARIGPSPVTGGGTGFAPEPAWAAWSLEQRRADAAARVARWRARNGGAALRLRLALPAGPGADQLQSQLAGDLAMIGVTLIRVGADAPADLRALDLVARYPGLAWYLNQLSCPARRTICSPAADLLLAAARIQPDAERRAAGLAGAAAALSAASVFLAFGPPVRWSLVRSDVPGFVANGAAFHPLPLLTVKPD